MRQSVVCRFAAFLLLMLLNSLAFGASFGTASVSPTATPAGVAASVTLTVPITDPSVIPSSSQPAKRGRARPGRCRGLLHDDGLDCDISSNDGIYSLRFTVYEQTPGTINYRASAAIQGKVTRVFSNTVGFTVTAVATNPNGTTSTASIQVTLDTTPPKVTVESPADGSATTEASVTVTGIVNDIVVGTVNSQQAKVTVNGGNAQVANRTYTAKAVPLQLGVNTLSVTGSDQTGNNATTTVKVTREAITQPFIKLVSGNDQSGPIASPLAAPLVVQALKGTAPVPNVPVIFKIVENDGFLSPWQQQAADHRRQHRCAGQGASQPDPRQPRRRGQ